MRKLLTKRLKGALTVMAFEWSRSFTFPRVALWVVLALFPPAIVTIICVAKREGPNDAIAFDLVLMFLIPQVVCLLGLLLWATPSVHSELEGRTWIYLAVRPDGKVMVVLGKFATAIGWTALACLSALTLSVIVGTAFERFARAARNVVRAGGHVFLASFGYGSLFTLMGVMFHRRAMVVAVAYTVASEFVIANVPAVINKVTIAHHLRSLLNTWRDWPKSRETSFLLSDAPPIQHLAMLLIITVACISVSVLVVRRREFITAEES